MNIKNNAHLPRCSVIFSIYLPKLPKTAEKRIPGYVQILSEKNRICYNQYKRIKFDAITAQRREQIVMIDQVTANDRIFEIEKLLGKGKGGYSYLVTDGKKKYVLKQIHHEPCDYYQFGNKLEAELNDYKRLHNIGITMPKIIDVDVKNERILKEYIHGDTIYSLILQDKMDEDYLKQLKSMCSLLYAANTNIDYFPTNFVVQKGRLFYIDYECNDYMDEWNFENWGIKYWSKTEEFLKYVKEH